MNLRNQYRRRVPGCSSNAVCDSGLRVSTRWPRTGFGGSFLAALVWIAASGSVPGLDSGPVESLSGKLNAIGSDSLNNLMTLWAEDFRRVYPEVVMEIEGKGSSTAPPALIEGTAQLGPMSRAMKSGEIDAFIEAHGYPPLAVPVAIDALAVFVNQGNPLEVISMRQLDAIFSSTRLRGGMAIERWGDLGLKAVWERRPISVYGRNSVSGTYGFFKEAALLQGDFRDRVKEQPGSSGVVQTVASDPASIGYSGIGYRTPGVKALKVSARTGGPGLPPSREACLSGEYPLARFLYVYVNKGDGHPLDPVALEFLIYALSDSGQGAVERAGYYRLPPEFAQRVVAELKR